MSYVGLLHGLAGGSIGGLLNPLGIFKPKESGNHANSNSQSLGGGLQFGPIGISGGLSSSSASASANGGGSASAKSDAQASGYNGYNGYGGYGGSNSNAQASANANAQGWLMISHIPIDHISIRFYI